LIDDKEEDEVESTYPHRVLTYKGLAILCHANA